MRKDYSTREVKIDIVVGTLLLTPFLLFLVDRWDLDYAALKQGDEMPPLVNYVICFSVAFLISTLLLVRREATGKQLVGAAVLLAFMLVFTGFMTWMVVNVALDGIIPCPRGEWTVRPDGRTVRTLPHTHRRLFHCVSCSNQHERFDADE